jgi:serine/threonine protein kinase
VNDLLIANSGLNFFRSVGVIMYRLIFNKLPYTGENWSDLAENIRKIPLQFPPYCEISEEAKDLLLGLLNRDPYQRISWEKFFTHQYFSTSSQQSCPPTDQIPHNANSVEFLEAQ